MGVSRIPGMAVEQAARLLGAGDQAEMRIREAAWIARCVGRGDAAPLTAADLSTLAESLQSRRFERGAVLFRGGVAAEGVWIVRQGRVELSVGSGRRRAVVHVLRPATSTETSSICLIGRCPTPRTHLSRSPACSCRLRSSSGCWPPTSASPAAGCPASRSGW